MSVTARAEETAGRLLRLMPRFQRWAATTVQANRDGQDLSLRQLAVIYLIREGVVFPSELARQLRISPAVVTGLLDRLAQRGYVQRVADASDRRRLRLALTDAGLAASVTVEHLLSRDVAEYLSHVPAADLESVGRALDLLERVVDALERDAPRLGPVAIEDEVPVTALDQEEVTAGSSVAVG
jgi:DNA-binding MarR family transcriptional regulator